MRVKKIITHIVVYVLFVLAVIGVCLAVKTQGEKKKTSKNVAVDTEKTSTEKVTKTETKTETETETETEPETETKEPVDPADEYLETVKFANEDEYVDCINDRYEQAGTEDDTDMTETENNLDEVSNQNFDLGDVDTDDLSDDDSFESFDKHKYDMLSSVDYTYSKFDKTSEINAESGFLVDLDSLDILYAKNGLEKRAPASTTKLLTALTVLEFLDLDEEVLVGKEQEFVAADASACGIKEGEKYTVYELLNGMLLCSGNDAAYTLAYYTGLRAYDRLENSEIYEYNTDTRDGEYAPECDDTNVYAADGNEAKKYIDECVKYMNKNAEEMGCVNVNFETPDGYDTEGQYVTAIDLARIGVMAKNNTVISDICASTSYYDKSLDVTWQTTNELMNKNGEFYNKTVDGLKTGSTGEAGKCFVGSASDNNNKFISVVLGSNQNGRWNDSNYLLNAGFKYMNK